MYKKFLFSTIIPFALIACNQNEDLKMQEGTVEASSEEIDFFSNSDQALLPNNTPAINSQNMEIQAVPTPAPTSIPTTTPANSNIKLNPEHGQPGHRCDIPVGAPLNSAPANNPAVPVQGNSAPANNPAVPVQGNSAPVSIQPSATPAPALSQSGNIKLNPEHGQPGHRCEIPVGAPLPE